jgi:hypothetical protein
MMAAARRLSLRRRARVVEYEVFPAEDRKHRRDERDVEREQFRVDSVDRGISQRPRCRANELRDIFPVQVVSKWMGHDPKICLAHYAQTTTDHFERAVSSAESGAPKAQKQAQQVDAGDGGESQREAISPSSIVSYAIPDDSQPDTAQTTIGAGGI